MFQSILSNLAIILLLHLTMSVVLDYRKKLSPFFFNLFIIILISSSVISIFYLPIRLGNYWVDMRFIPLIFAAYIHGWRVAVPSLLIASLWRFLMDGDGMIPGILFGMVGPTLLALAFHPRSEQRRNYIEKIGIVIGSWLICDLPIIIFMPNGLEIFKEIAFIRGTSFVITSIVLYIFISQNRQRYFQSLELEKTAGEDPLTKLLNKRKFFEIVESQIAEVPPKHKHFIAMLDIDHFKKFNDSYGHLVGDQILEELANLLKKFESDRTIIGRYGGEEFIIYIGNVTDEDAQKIICDIHEEIRLNTFFIDKIPIQITTSIGLAVLEDNASLLDTVNQADKNLYKAKRNGRNCFIFH